MREGRTAIVHIGHKKTGTTAIQHQFDAHRAALLELGVFYPLDEANHSFALSALFRGRNRSLTSSYLDDVAASRARIDAELAAAKDWSQLVFSAESVAGFSRAELTGLRDWLLTHVETVRIVFVIRDPVDWAVSVAQQHLKSRSDLDALLTTPEPVRWTQIIQRLRAVFGAEALTVLEYEQLAKVRERFAARFARAIGLPGDAAKVLLAEQPRVNESLSAEAAMLFARYNAAVPEWIDGARNPARSGVEMRAFAGLGGHRFDLPEAARRQAWAQSREDAAFVARELGITRYDYPESALTPGSYDGGLSPAFLDAVAARLVALNNEALAAQMLLVMMQARAKGDEAGAARMLAAAAERFPTDPRVVKEVARAARRAKRG